MKLPTLTTQQKVSWGIALGLLAVLLLAAVSPLAARYLEYREAADTNAGTLDTLRFLKASRPTLEEAWDAYQGAGLEQWLYPVGQGQDQVALAIQKRVTESIEGNGASLQSVSILSGKAGEDYHEPGVRVDFQGGVEAVLLVLLDLETSMPLLVVDNLTLTPQRARRRTQAADSQEMLAQMEVRSFVPAGSPAL